MLSCHLYSIKLVLAFACVPFVFVLDHHDTNERLWTNHWVAGSMVSFVPEMVTSIPMSQMAKLRAQRRYFPGLRTQCGRTKVQAHISLPRCSHPMGFCIQFFQRC